jgi:tetratricopeptide (TPR) repeat protein
MPTDRYDLKLTTTSDAARDAYVEGCNLLLTLYPGAGGAFDTAIAADPDFALAHAGLARLLQLSGKLPEAREAIARAATSPANERETSHIGVFKALIEARADDAFAAVCAHTDRWPTDAMVLATAANQLGLIGISGRAGRVQELAAFLDKLAPPYGDDWWFGAHHGMAVSEAGRHAEARRIVERSLAGNRRNGSVAHSYAHVCYEDGNPEEGIAFIRSWLPDYTRFGGMYGHLNWHLALFELHQGNADEGFRMFGESFGAEDYPGPLPNKMFDAAAFLWRAELAGNPRDEGRWAMLRDFAHASFPQPGLNLLDWHVALAEAVTGDTETLEARLRTIEDRAAHGRYGAGHTIPDAARAFAAFERKDFSNAIDLLERLLPEQERIGGSNAQIDLVEFTLLRAYVLAGRRDAASALLAARRPGAVGAPVAGFH